jgi:hypothetical protein
MVTMLLHCIYTDIMYFICNFTALLDLGHFFQSLNHTQSVGLLGRGVNPLQGCNLYTEQHKQNKRTQTSMPRVGFEPTTTMFERTNTVHSTVIDDT